MGRRVGGHTDGIQMQYSSLNSVIKGEVLKSASLNCVIPGEVILTSNLNADVVLFTSRELQASLNANVRIPSTLLNGLLSYWSLDGNFLDPAGSKNGTGNNVTFGSGKIGQAGVFSGSNSRVTFSAVSVTNTFTISAWIYPTSDANSWQAILCQDTNNGLFRRGGGAINYYPAGLSTTGTPLNTWSHVVVRNTAGSMRFFINGVMDSPNPTFNGTPNFVVMGDSNSSEYFVGNIDEVGVWNRALTDSEITQLYNAGSGNAYPF